MRKLTADEIWKDIPNYEHLYKISNLGNVINCISKNELKGSLSKNGYIYISLYKNKKRKTYKLHRLVAITFLENPNNKSQVNHIDGNKQNNKVSNLEWCTQSENQIHAFKNRLNYGRYGTENGHHRKIIQFDKNMNKLKEWDYMTDAQNKLGINVANICNCCKGKIKTIGGYIFRYAEVL